MKIKTRLYLSACVTIGLIALLIAFSLFFSSGMKKQLEKNRFASELSRKIGELVLVTDEYLAYHYERSAQQWEMKYEEIFKVVRNEQSGVFGHLQTDLESLRDSFLSLVSATQKQYQLGKDNDSGKEVKHISLLEERLVGRIRLISNKIMVHAFNISQNTLTLMEDLQRKDSTIVFAVALLLICLISVSSYFTIRKITRPLRGLVESAAIIEKGNFEHQMRVQNLNPDGRPRDEIGELSVSFESMTRKLIQSIEDLQTEVLERKRAEQNLLKERTLLKTIIDKIPVMLTRYNPDAHMIYLNKEFEKIVGWKTEEVQDMDMMEKVYPDPDYRQQAMEYMQKASTEWREFRVQSKSGKIIDSEWSNICMEDGTQIGIGINITERKQMEEALQKSNSLLSSIMDSPDNVIMFALDKSYNYLSFNKAHVKAMKFAYDANIEIGRHILSYIPNEDDRLKAEKNYIRVLKGERFIESQEYGLLENRSWYELIFNPIADISNQITGFTVFLTDISERKRAEGALRENEAKFRTLFENSKDAIYINTREGQFIDANQSMLDLFGYTREEMLKINKSELYANPNKRSAVTKELEEKGFLRDYETKYKKKDGTDVDCLLTASLWRSYDGSIRGYQGIIRDISEKMRLRDQLAKAQKMEAMGLMAGGVAHDLNNILSGIVSYPELLLMNLPEGSPLREPIKTIQESGMRAADVVEDLMTIARGVASSKEPLNLSTMVEEYLKSAEHLKLERTHSFVSFKTELDPDILNMSGSPTHIKKILMNLVANASEAIEGSGTVTISALNQYLDKPLKGYEDVRTGEYTMLAVSDDGSGISPGDLERIFEPFYTKKVMGRAGTGLGLAVVWNTTQDYNGYINVNSSEKGTTFELYFPVTREEVAAEGEEVPLKDYLGHGERILVVDDDENQREIASGMLTQLGYNAESVSSGEDAIEYIKEHSVDLIVLDMVMPKGINGRKTYEEIIKIRPGQKAIIASGYAKSREMDIAQELGAGKYVKKPYILEKIGVAVKEELRK